MYKLSKRREMTIEKDGIAVKQQHGDTVVLPINCWKKVLQYLPTIDEHIPNLKEGRKVFVEKNIGSGYVIRMRQAYQCIVIRKIDWRSDPRQIYFIVDVEYTTLHDILPRILEAAEMKARPRFPTYSYIDPDPRYIPGLTIINGENE